MMKQLSIAILLVFGFLGNVFSQETITVRPKEINDVLVNPGIGFMTFQRFNGDELNTGKSWTEGMPIEYQDFDGDLENENYPATSLAYFRIYWKFIEPEQDKYRWDMFDKALKTAQERGQTLLIRIAPYGTGADRDVPDWYRKLVGPKNDWSDKKWQVDPEDPRYAEHFGGMIRDLGKRYDGHPNLESVDVSIVGAWGEGAGSDKLSRETRQALVDAYLDAFKKTDLIMLLTDIRTNGYGLSQRNVGWRVDCLGDMGGFSATWNHMEDYYPQAIINFGMRDAWKKAPVSLEVCWVMQHWKDEGWDIDHIIDESLKWRISSFNAKSSLVPSEWKPQVDRWLNSMAYRYVLRKFTYPSKVNSGDKLLFTSWWENKGVAPCYKPYPLSFRIRDKDREWIIYSDADIRTWMPGDNLYDDAIKVPSGIPDGEYSFDLALLDLHSDKPKVQLAIDGKREDGWYPLGRIRIDK